MLKKYIVNGKITYTQENGALTQFTFTNVETGEMFSLATIDQAEADEITYGDHVTIEVRKDLDPPKAQETHSEE